MTIETHGFAACEKGDRYIQQLVKHWGHKFPTSYADGLGTVPFSEGKTAEFRADDQGIQMKLIAPSEEEDLRLRDVIAKHIDRFAFREAPLAYKWGESE